MNHKQLLLEQLVRVRCYGHLIRFGQIRYCLQCNLPFHGRRYSVTARPITANSERNRQSRQRHTPFGCLVFVWQKELYGLNMRERSYAMCRYCSSRNAIPIGISSYIDMIYGDRTQQLFSYRFKK